MESSLAAEALRRINQNTVPSAAVAEYRDTKSKKEKKDNDTSRPPKTPPSKKAKKAVVSAREIAEKYVREAGLDLAVLKKVAEKKKKKTSQKSKKAEVVDLTSPEPFDDIESPGETPDGIEDCSSSEEPVNNYERQKKEMKRLMEQKDQSTTNKTVKRKPKKLDRSLTDSQRRMFFSPDSSPASLGVKEDKLLNDESSQAKMMKFIEKQARLIQIYKKMNKGKGIKKKKSGMKVQAAASSKQMGPIRFKDEDGNSVEDSGDESDDDEEEEVSDEASAESDEEEEEEDDEDEVSSEEDGDGSSQHASPPPMKLMKTEVVAAKGSKQASAKPTAPAQKTNRRGRKVPTDNFATASNLHTKKWRRNLPSAKVHKKAPKGQNVDDVMSNIKTPLRSHRWNVKTYTKYQFEYRRYASFIDAIGLDCSPKGVSIWSLQAYTDLLAETAGFQQSRAQYFSNFKMFATAASPWGAKMLGVYSTCFGILQRMVAIRSKAEGLRLSNIMHLSLFASKNLNEVVLEKEVRVGNKSKTKRITRKMVTGFWIRGWFGMLRADDLMHTTCTVMETAKTHKVKYVVEDSKTDPDAHGAEFHLACACEQTKYGPWEVPTCPVCCISDADFSTCKEVIGGVQKARTLFAKTCTDANFKCDAKFFTPHSLRIGSIGAAYEGGLVVETIKKLARHRRVDTTLDYTQKATLVPDDVMISWPLARGHTIKEIFAE